MVAVYLLSCIRREAPGEVPAGNMQKMGTYRKYSVGGGSFTGDAKYGTADII